MTLIIILVVVVVLVLGVIGIYNNLVKLRNNRENAFANIDVQLKQRHDLIPQLVATVKGYAEHEKELLTRVTEARAAAMSATGINDKIQAENALSSALAGLKVSLEAYPDLKANQNFLPELPAAADRDCRHREQDCRNTPLLQYRYPRAEQRSADLPVKYSRRYVRIQEGTDVRDSSGRPRYN